jgi:hypothetical protein
MVLLWSSFWIFSLPIMVRDLRSQRIPNIYLKFLAFVTGSFLVIDGMGSLLNLLFLGIFLISALILRVGMGDIKLLALSFMIFNSQMIFSPLPFLSLLLSCAFAHLLIESLLTRQVPERIALAPSIFFAFVLYLGAR